ncbi:hypothetical protein [Lactobacillus helveticus]|uniref:Uncharacterized protein n=1 Tax=Lactobacillus helveticus TaxID=1587 RepID=A0A3Q8SPS4_LACHE|nr:MULTISPECIES: hypothetical protein [Lactobacillaceae]AZK92455.1 hypothetical protein LH5_02269 [Lactobacillus helveticus]MCJ2191041.1 hypothetical protein [Lactobacillus helveticus]UOE24548.1 hypothetical protein MTX28_10970 [Lactobacillus helveticus]UWE07265.1 hypothetical protein NW893_11050 [Lactobacillus helveticus]UWE07272.1 hypothetical protein NW893_11005 [Lactobacillus helveticus]
MSKKIWMIIFRYLLAIGLFLAYSAIFDNQDHDLIIKYCFCYMSWPCYYSI